MAVALLLAGGLYLGLSIGLRTAISFVIGGGLGLALYHGRFGFTAAYRRLLTERRSAGLRAQFIMLALAAALFAPLLGNGEAFGLSLAGAQAPLGVPLVIGAFLFGIGMQLGGGCASGTLFTVGGGSTRMLLTLGTFVIGSYVGTWHDDWWRSLPTIPPFSFGQRLGWSGGLLAQLALIGTLYTLAWRIERARHGTVEPLRWRTTERTTGVALLRGPWPLLWAAIALALLNTLTLLTVGRPWGITWAFALWGAKISAALGADPGAFAYWRAPGAKAALEAPIGRDITSVMDIGIVLGALLAAALAGRFAPSLKIAPGVILGSLLGGFLLGYGARLSYGCNIGAFFSGVASGSLHGWVWLAAALVGNYLGLSMMSIRGLSKIARNGA
jgi:hypothetical protein